jgi:hypothetical protein
LDEYCFYKKRRLEELQGTLSRKKIGIFLYFVFNLKKKGWGIKSVRLNKKRRFIRLDVKYTIHISTAINKVRRSKNYKENYLNWTA